MGRGFHFGVDWFQGDCGALLFSKSGEELEYCNENAKGMFQNLKSLQDFLGRMVPSGTAGIFESLERYGSWNAKSSGQCNDEELNPYLSLWRLHNPMGDDEGRILVLLKGCGGKGGGRKTEKPACVRTGATEDRLREQLQTLQRKLLSVVTENEALSTRLAGLRSVCLEQQEQLTSMEVALHLDSETHQHLLHLCSTALSYCNVESRGSPFSCSGSMGKMNDLEGDDLADYREPEVCLRLTCTTGRSTVAAEAAAAAAAAAVATASFVCSAAPAITGPSAVDNKSKRVGSATAAPAEPDYASLMDSFVTLKASYDVLLQQQEAASGKPLAPLTTTPADAGGGTEGIAGVASMVLSNPSNQRYLPKGQPGSARAQPDTVAGVLSLGSGSDGADQGVVNGIMGSTALSADWRADISVCDETCERMADGELERLAAHARALKASFDVMQMQRDQAISRAAVQKAQFDQFVADKAEEKAVFDRVLEETAAEAVAQKALADKALVDFGELQDSAAATKAQFDKFVLDKTDEKAAFDRVLEQTAAEAAQQKAVADKALVDFVELRESAAATKAQFDKFVHDKSEEKAAFDQLLERTAADAAAHKAIADKALVDFGELQESAATTKAQFDKFVLDKAEEKAVFDRVLEQTAAEAAQQKAIAYKALLDCGELQESATMVKAQFDKFVLDKAEEKAVFDRVLEQTAAEAAQQKATADKALVDFGELQDSARAAKAQFDKFVADKAEEKATFDRVLEQTAAEAAQQKAIADKALVDFGELQESAAATKAQFDKFVLDKAEEKAVFDRVLEHTVAEAAQQKAIADKALVDFGELQESATTAKAQFDKFVLDKAEEKATLDRVLEQTVAEAAQQKAIADKALIDFGVLQESAYATKAIFDKFVLDKTEEKAVFDRVLEQTAAEAAQQKAIADKALVDFGELQESAVTVKAQFDKFVLNKAEEKAVFDQLLEQTAAEAAAQKALADKALVDFTELQESAVSTKAQFDKLVLDKAEEKATFDQLLEQTVAEAAHQKAIADKALMDFGELQETANHARAQFDKFVLDKAEEKAVFDRVLEHTVAEAAQQKAIADKALVDFGELQDIANMAKAQFDKFVADKAEEKATFDRVLELTAAEAAQQKAIADKALVDMNEIQESAVANKAQFDKFVADKAEEKATFDRVLEQTVAEAAVQKAIADKALIDFSEQKAIADKAMVDFSELQVSAEADRAGHEKALLDLADVQASAASTKAQFDKYMADTVEGKAVFDRVLERTAAEAAEHKAVADKALVDFGELQANAAADKAEHDKALLVLVEAQESAAGTKAQFDKFVIDKAEEKATFDKLYEDSLATQKAIADKALVDLSTLQVTADTTKAQFDKFVLDKAEEKAVFDRVLERTAAEAAQQKAFVDKALVDMSEMQHEVEASRAQFEKLLQDKVEEKAELDAVLERTAAEAQANKMLVDALKVEANAVAAQLAAERLTYGDLQAQHERLLKQQEVLQAELQMALSNYTPKAIIDAGTPADKILSMMTDLLDGSPPSIQDILLVQSAILEAHDIYQPINLGKQLLQSSALDSDVGMALLQQLGNGDEARALSNGGTELTLRDFGTRDSTCGRAGPDAKASDSTPSSSSCSLTECTNPDGPWSSLEGAITALMAPDAAFPDAGARENYISTSQLEIHGARSASNFSRSLHARMRGRGAAASSAPQQPDFLGQLDRANTSSSLALESEVDDFPECPIFSEVERLLATSNNWQFDVFKLADATQDHALSTLAFYLFHQSDLIRRFDIRPQILARFMRRVEDGYRPNPYHSKTHAADVLQTLHVIIHRGGLSPGYVDPLTLMACYFAALVHDYEHGGLTNDFLINSSDLLALRYNDRAPLENHHLAAAFTLLKKPEYAFMSHLPKADTDRLRKMAIELVLATDMKQHFAIMSHFTTVHRLGAANSMTPSLISGTERRRSSSNASSVNSMAPGGSGTAVEMDKIVIPLDENERILSLQMALKCADLGHVSASLPVHCKWVQLLEEEFFRQGDMEKVHGLSVSPLFDRCKPGITKSQVGFFDIVVIPLLNCFSRVFSNTKPLLTYTMRNYKYWAEQQKLEQHVGPAGCK